MKKTQIIIQVRAGSSRLPGKAFLFFEGFPMFIAIAKKIQQQFAQVLVVTSNQPNDDLTAHFCKTFEIPFFRGDENNVYKRYLDALEHFPCDHFVRLTGDNPLIDLEALQYGLQFFKAKACQVASSRKWNATDQMLRTLPKGKSIDIFKSDYFVQSYSEDLSSEDKEHIITAFKKDIQLIDFNTPDSNENFSIDRIEDYRRLILD